MSSSMEESVRLSQVEYKILQRFGASQLSTFTMGVAALLLRKDILWGYLHAAVVFGSIGVISAGFMTLVACFSSRDIEGKICGNMGFEPQGENFGWGKNAGHYIIETRMDELIKELNIDKNRIIGVSQVRCLESQNGGHDRAPMCFLQCYIYLSKSGCQRP